MLRKKACVELQLKKSTKTHYKRLSEHPLLSTMMIPRVQSRLLLLMVKGNFYTMQVQNENGMIPCLEWFIF